MLLVMLQSGRGGSNSGHLYAEAGNHCQSLETAHAPACLHAAAARTSHQSWRAGRCGRCAPGASRWRQWSPHASWQHCQQTALCTRQAAHQRGPGSTRPWHGQMTASSAISLLDNAGTAQFDPGSPLKAASSCSMLFTPSMLLYNM